MVHRGYHAEHEIAKRLDAKRIGGPGNMDIDGGWFSAEVKQRDVPRWMRWAMRGAKIHARDGQLSLVIIHQKGDCYDDARVSMSLKDFMEWFGGARPTRFEMEIGV